MSVQRVPPFVWLYLRYLPKRHILHFIFQNKLHYSMLLWYSVRRSRSRFCLPRQRQGCMQLQSNAIKLLKLKIKQMCSQTAWLEWKWGWRRLHYGKVWRGSSQQPCSVFFTQTASFREAQPSLCATALRRKQIKIGFSISTKLFKNMLAWVNQLYQYYSRNSK